MSDHFEISVSLPWREPMSAERCLGFVAIGVLFTISVVETFYFPLSRSFSSIPMLVGLVTIGMGHGAFDSELIFGGDSGGLYRGHPSTPPDAVRMAETGVETRRSQPRSRPRWRIGSSRKSSGDRIGEVGSAFLKSPNQWLTSSPVDFRVGAIRYRLGDLLRERVYAMALGYSTQEDVDRLAQDPAFRVAVWDRSGDNVLDERLASQPTQSRLLTMMQAKQLPV